MEAAALSAICGACCRIRPWLTTFDTSAPGASATPPAPTSLSFGMMSRMLCASKAGVRSVAYAAPAASPSAVSPAMSPAWRRSIRSVLRNERRASERGAAATGGAGGGTAGGPLGRATGTWGTIGASAVEGTASSSNPIWNPSAGS